ncbi:MAG: hypothetical protein U0359_28035 [Byssovorax sp.]
MVGGLGVAAEVGGAPGQEDERANDVAAGGARVRGDEALLFEGFELGAEGFWVGDGGGLGGEEGVEVLGSGGNEGETSTCGPASPDVVEGRGGGTSKRGGGGAEMSFGCESGGCFAGFPEGFGGGLDEVGVAAGEVVDEVLLFGGEGDGGGLKESVDFADREGTERDLVEEIEVGGAGASVGVGKLVEAADGGAAGDDEGEGAMVSVEETAEAGEEFAMLGNVAVDEVIEFVDDKNQPVVGLREALEELFDGSGVEVVFAGGAVGLVDGGFRVSKGGKERRGPRAFFQKVDCVKLSARV